jgi:CMP-N-acetylneuraminic acid synthetase
MMKTKRIAYIPARSGSKGVPKKNIRLLCGKPMLGWMVQAAVDTGLFDKVMVSTDSQEFADVAESCGAWVPFLRDPEFAKDSTSTVETICSDKARLEEMGEKFDVFCLLQATSPLCRPEDIAGAIALHEKVNAGVVSLMKSDARPIIMRTLDMDGRASPILETRDILRRQDEPVFYELNGAIYINSWSELVRGLKPAYNPYGYVMDTISSTDVDDEDDFRRAERLMTERLSQNHNNTIQG